MSPVLILSRLCLKRRFQFFGISEMSSESTASTFFTVSASMMRRRPALPAFSHGTMTVMSLWRILIVRYRRTSPRISLSSSFIVAGADAAQPAGSCLQIAVHEVDLLQPAKALADVLRTDLTHAVDRLQLGVGGGEDLVEPAELAHDVLHHQLREPGDASQDAVAAGGDGIVERVDLAVVAERLG